MATVEAPVRNISSRQDAYARQLTREGKLRREPGDGAKSIFTNAAIGLGATAIDVGQGVVFEKIMQNVFQKKNDALRESMPAAMHKEDREKIVTPQYAALDFVAEWGTDLGITTLGNAVVSTLTGSDEKYVSETSAFVADWANTIVQVFYENPTVFKLPRIGTEVKSRDLVDPVNLEAAFRILSELPGGGAVEWLLDKTNHALEHSSFVKFTNNAAAKGILGYHIQNSHNKGLVEALAKAVSVAA